MLERVAGPRGGIKTKGFKLQTVNPGLSGKYLITDRTALKKNQWSFLVQNGVITKEKVNLFSTKSYLDADKLKELDLSKINNWGKIKVPSSLEYKNTVEAITGGMCEYSRVDKYGIYQGMVEKAVQYLDKAKYGKYYDIIEELNKNNVRIDFESSKLSYRFPTTLSVNRFFASDKWPDEPEINEKGDILRYEGNGQFLSVHDS